MSNGKPQVTTDDVKSTLLPWEQEGAQSDEAARQSLFDLLGSDPEFEEPTDDGLQPEESGEEEVEDDAPEGDDLKDLEDFEDGVAEGEDEEADEELYVVKVDGDEIQVSFEELLNGYSRTEYLTRTRQKESAEHKARLAEISKAQEEYAAKLAEVEQVLGSLSGQDEPDWDKIQRERPNEFPKLFREHQQRKKAIETVKAEREKELKALSEKEVAARQEYLDEQFALLRQAVPEWQDPAQLRAGLGEVTQFAQTLGFSQEELSQVYDHRVILLLRMAQRGQKLEGKGAQKLRQAKQGSKRIEPGGRKRTSSTGKPGRQKTHAKRADRVARTGSVKDAARLFEGLLEDGIL